MLFFLGTFFCTKNMQKHMILSFKMKGGVISGHFLMLWFQKYSLDTVGFRTYGGGFRFQSPKPKSDILSPKCAYGGGAPV